MWKFLAANSQEEQVARGADEAAEQIEGPVVFALAAALGTEGGGHGQGGQAAEAQQV